MTASSFFRTKSGGGLKQEGGEKVRRGESENCMEEKSCSSRPHTSLQTNETEKEGGDQKSEAYQSCDRNPNFVKAKRKSTEKVDMIPLAGWPNRGQTH